MQIKCIRKKFCMLAWRSYTIVRFPEVSGQSEWCSRTDSLSPDRHNSDPIERERVEGLHSYTTLKLLILMHKCFMHERQDGKGVQYMSYKIAAAASVAWLPWWSSFSHPSACGVKKVFFPSPNVTCIYDSNSYFNGRKGRWFRIFIFSGAQLSIAARVLWVSEAVRSHLITLLAVLFEHYLHNISD